MPKIETRSVEHQNEGDTLEDIIFTRNGCAAWKRPTVLVFHGIEGRSDVEVDFAKRVAEWGYLGIAADLFGQGTTQDSLGRCGERATVYMRDRAMLRERLLHVLDAAKTLPEVDKSRVVAVGFFCFGGLCALDLARTGADVRGVVSFHGLLAPPGIAANISITGKVIIFHGWEDPFAPPEDMTAIVRELSDRGADWQIHYYSQTVNTFMGCAAASPEGGTQHNDVFAQRAWASLEIFLTEAFA